MNQNSIHNYHKEVLKSNVLTLLYLSTIARMRLWPLGSPSSKGSFEYYWLIGFNLRPLGVY